MTAREDIERLNPEMVIAAKKSRGKSIRLHCLECCCGNSKLVRECAMHDCFLWPWRMGPGRPQSFDGSIDTQGDDGQ